MRSQQIRGAIVVGACVAVLGCPSRESVGTRTVAILGAGIVNDPGNKSLRFDLLKFGLDNFCAEMQRRGAPLKLSDDEPVVGRFFADSCQSQVLDDEAHKSFVIQYTGHGYAWTNLTSRIGFSSRGVVEYAPDFQMHEGAMYVYFRPRMLDGAAFQTLFVESALARGGLAMTGVSADDVGKKIVDSELRRGFTVIRYDAGGETDFGLGVIAKGARPFKPFQLKSSDKQTLANDRTEVHAGQQDYIGTLEVKDSGQALYLTMTLDGAPAVDVFVVPIAAAASMVERYTHAAGGALLPAPALLDETLTRGALWQRFVNVEPGNYFVVIDNTAQAGRTAPSSAALDNPAAKVDYLLLLGERP